MTGAPIPAGADAVAPVEWTEPDGDRVRIGRAPTLGQHVRPAGQDVLPGDELVGGRPCRHAARDRDGSDVGLSHAGRARPAPRRRRSDGRRTRRGGSDAGAGADPRRERPGARRAGRRGRRHRRRPAARSRRHERRPPRARRSARRRRGRRLRRRLDGGLRRGPRCARRARGGVGFLAGPATAGQAARVRATRGYARLRAARQPRLVGRVLRAVRPPGAREAPRPRAYATPRSRCAS